MGIYKEVQVEVNLTKRVESYFRCLACGAEADALAIGMGTGEGISPYGLDQDAAGQRAHSAADRNALEEAHTALAVAPCPQCGERDRAAVIMFKRKTSIGVVKALSLFVTAGGLLSALMAFDRTPIIVGTVIGLIAAIIVYKSRVQRFGDAANQVQFAVRSPYRQQALKEGHSDP